MSSIVSAVSTNDTYCLWMLLNFYICLCHLSLFACGSQCTFYRIQRVQNVAARLLCGATARPHAAPLAARVEQNSVLTLMFDIYHGTAPQYLSELVRRCDDTRLWSSVHGNFVVSRSQLHVTDKAFSIAEPCAWNALPSGIKLISSRTSFCNKTRDTPFQSILLNFFLVFSMLLLFFVYSTDTIVCHHWAPVRGAL